MTAEEQARRQMVTVVSIVAALEALAILAVVLLKTGVLGR